MFNVAVLEHSDCYCRCYVISIMARQTLLLFCTNLLFSWVVSWYLHIHGNAYSPKLMFYSDFRHLTLRTQRMRHYNYSVFYTGCSPAVIPKKIGAHKCFKKTDCSFASAHYALIASVISFVSVGWHICLCYNVHHFSCQIYISLLSILVHFAIKNSWYISRFHDVTSQISLCGEYFYLF